MKVKSLLALAACLLAEIYFAQAQTAYKTWNPAIDTVNALEGQAWPGEVKNFYDRLPASAEKTVRQEVWEESESSAGLQLRFQTNATEIVVKYKVTGGIQFPHMPATGVSGVDLYSKTIDGNWLWAAGKYSFGDTVVYRFKNLEGKDQHVGNREYTLYLPLYNNVKWMEISVPAESMFKPRPVRKEKPIVVYGTSIAQGGCTSRPGLAWTNILTRKLDHTLINLGFSGNGRLEKELIDLLTGIDAKLYALDCLPNLVGSIITIPELKQRIVASVNELQNKRPGVPILLVDHDGYTEEGINPDRRNEYQVANKAQREVFDSLLSKGIKNIYYLTKEEIGQDIESMVDGTHPNDIGMMHYADAYEKKIRAILKEEGGASAITHPISQRRDANIYDWENRHNEVMRHNKMSPPGLVLMGNSITHYWGGEPAAPIARGDSSWNKYFEKRNPVNMGFGWDRIENVLWRVYHGELDRIAPKDIVLMIGTNNLQLNTNEEIIEGLGFLLKEIRKKQPVCKILLMGIFPRREKEERVAALNKMIAKIPEGPRIKYADAGKLLVKADAKIDESLFTDGLHPNQAGYEKIGAFINQQLGK